VDEPIIYPFDIDYRSISAAIACYGKELVKEDILSKGYSETVANVIIKTALKLGWGS